MDQKQVNNVLMDTNNFKTIFFNYFPAISLLWFFAIILSSPDRNLLQISGGITFMNFWAYFIHKGLHNLPREGFIGYINTHWLFHHQQTKLIDRRLELSLEFFTDLAMNLSILILQVFSGIWFVPLSVVLFYTLVYTSVHIINYSILVHLFIEIIIKI